MFAILRYAFMDSNPHREESAVIKKKKVESMEVLLEDEYRAHKETSQKGLFC